MPFLLPAQKLTALQERVKATASQALPPAQTQLAAIAIGHSSSAADTILEWLGLEDTCPSILWLDPTILSACVSGLGCSVLGPELLEMYTER